MSFRAPQRGPKLPYRPMAGVIPVGRKGWLVASGKLQGIQLFPQAPEVFKSLTEVLDYRPSYEIIALGHPVGLLDKPRRGGRPCDHEARLLLKWRGSAVISAPSRKVLRAGSYEAARKLDKKLSPFSWALGKKVAEIEKEIQPYWQRTVFEVHPELSFYQLNEDVPMTYSKHSEEGQKERREVLERRLKGVERILDAELPGVKPYQLLDAAACLWTSRRIASRAVSRLPEFPEWDTEGLRMEILR